MAITAPAPRVLADVLPRSWVQNILLIIGGAALVGAAAQISFPLPFSPVPLTGQTFAVLLVGAALGSARGMISMLVYGLAGLVGVPWFAGFASGFAMASFGYIIGFIVAAGLVGYLAERGWTRTAIDTALAMVLGNVVVYAIGVTWLKFTLAGTTWAGAVAMGMSPFLLGDGLKIALAAGVFPLVWSQLVKRGLAPREADVPEVSVSAKADAEVVQTLDLRDDSEDKIDITESSPADATETMKDTQAATRSD